MKTYLPKPFLEAPQLDHAFQPEQINPHFALLINPFYPKDPHSSFGKHVLTPTLALTSIAASTPDHWKIRYWDENLLQGPPPVNPFPQVVGITVHLTFAERAYELSHWFRARGAIVVMGGLHAISCPDEVREHCDILAIGEGVQLWGEILRDIDRGNMQREYRAKFRKPYREDPAPRRNILPTKGFLTTTSLNATRGCHNRCDFCYLSTEGLHVPYQMRAPAQIAKEIQADAQPYAVFTDNNLGSKPKYLRELCRALAPLKMIWSAAVSIDVSDDPSLVREMALSGCTGVFVGFESLQNDNILGAGKRSPNTADYARRVRIFHEHGIQVNGSFVFGFDHDRPDIFARTVDWVEENHLECATFHILTPYPGTPLFDRMAAEDRILHRDWRLYDTAHVVFRPRHMSPEVLAEGYEWSYQRLFSHASIWRRRPADARAVLPYLAMSYLYKRSNRFWHYLIQYQLTATVWRPLVEWTRRRHLRFRVELAREYDREKRAASVVSASV